MTKLTGPELLAKIQELNAAGVTDKNSLCRETGYSSTVEKDGVKTEQFHRSAFQDAYFAASAGFTPTAGAKRPGKPATFVAKVQKSGGLVIGPVYLEDFDAAKFKIDVTEAGIILTPIAAVAAATA